MGPPAGSAQVEWLLGLILSLRRPCVCVCVCVCVYVRVCACVCVCVCVSVWRHGAFTFVSSLLVSKAFSFENFSFSPAIGTFPYVSFFLRYYTRAHHTHPPTTPAQLCEPFPRFNSSYRLLTIIFPPFFSRPPLAPRALPGNASRPRRPRRGAGRRRRRALFSRAFFFFFPRASREWVYSAAAPGQLRAPAAAERAGIGIATTRRR